MSFLRGKLQEFQEQMTIAIEEQHKNQTASTEGLIQLARQQSEFHELPSKVADEVRRISQTETLQGVCHQASNASLLSIREETTASPLTQRLLTEVRALQGDVFAMAARI